MSIWENIKEIQNHSHSKLVDKEAKSRFNIHKSININKRTTITKVKNILKSQKPDDHLNRCKKKAFDKIQHPFMKKGLSRLRIRGNFLTLKGLKAGIGVTNVSKRRCDVGR